jgi:quercetin dioxygenase-like cupin family protein
MRKLPVLMALASLLAVLGVAVAVATPPRGVTRTEVSKAILNGGGPVEFKSGTETVVLKVTAEPGGSTGWHSHPDGGVFIVDKGTLTNYGLNGPACEAVITKAGQAYFVPPHAHHPHLGRNNGTEKLEVTVYYFNVPPGQSTRIDEERPKECPADLN